MAVSKYVRDRAEKLKANCDFIGRQRHYIVETEKGEKHQVAIQVSCDCNFMSCEGIANPNKGVCAHIVAAQLDMIKIEEKKCQVQEKEKQ